MTNDEKSEPSSFIPWGTKFDHGLSLAGADLKGMRTLSAATRAAIVIPCVGKKTNSESIPCAGFMRLPAILKVFPVSRSTWWAGVASSKYPPGVKLPPRVTAWKVEDIRLLNQQSGGA